MKAFPNCFRGVCAIPQAPGAPITLGFRETGKPFDDIKPPIDAIQTLTDQDRRNIFEDNARRLFSRLQIPRSQTVSR